jgi:hypothetical protein
MERRHKILKILPVLFVMLFLEGLAAWFFPRQPLHFRLSVFIF